MRFAPVLLAAAAFGAACSLAGALADPVTKTQPAPPRFSGGGAALQDGTAPPPPAAAPASEPIPPAGDAEDPGRFIVEKRRIKRTVPMDLQNNLDGVWDRLYSMGVGSARRTVYFDWDDNFVYLAAESTQRETVRFDLDARGDGWYRGADNLRFTVAPGVAGDALGGLDTHRWDMVQNKSVPVWAASPIPEEAIKTITGRTPGGMYAVLLAIGRTELAGLERRSGAELGLRVEFGILPPDQIADPTVPLPQLTLADTVPARIGPLISRVEVTPRRVVPGETVQATLEVRNAGAAPIRLDRLFVRGSKAAQPFLDAAEYTGQTLAPGKTIRRTFRSAVATGAGMGAIVVAGGVERENGGSAAALAAFDRVEPFAVSLQVDRKPVPAGSAETRTALVAVTSRGHGRNQARVTLHLPPGWAAEPKDFRRDVTLTFPGDTKPAYFKIAVPATAQPGAYPLRATVDVAGRTYAASGEVAVTEALVQP